VAELPLDWEQWLGQIERLFLAFITVGALFEQRDAPGSLSEIRAAVEQQAKLPFDETSLQLIASLRTDLVVLGQVLTNGRPSAEPVWRLHFAAGRRPQRPQPDSGKLRCRIWTVLIEERCGLHSELWGLTPSPTL